MSMFNGDCERYRQLMKQYTDYLDLYKFFNKGSVVGAVPFSTFYWRMTYQMSYLDPSLIGISKQ